MSAFIRSKPSRGEITVAAMAVVCLLLQQLLLSLHLGAHHQVPFRALADGAEVVTATHAGHAHPHAHGEGGHLHRLDDLDEQHGAGSEHHPHPEDDHQAQRGTRAPWPGSFAAAPAPAGIAVVALPRDSSARCVEGRKEARPPAVSRTPAAPRAPPVVS